MKVKAYCKKDKRETWHAHIAHNNCVCCECGEVKVIRGTETMERIEKEKGGQE